MKKNKGFTLIELMIVIVIVGILAAIGVPIYRQYVAKAMASEGKALAGAIASAEKVYYAEVGSFYPITIYTSYNSTPLNIDARGNRYFRYFMVNTAASSINITVSGTDKSGRSMIVTLTASLTGQPTGRVTHDGTVIENF